MQKLKSFAVIALFGIAALGLTSSPAKALVIYSYTGNNFTNILDNTPPAGSYTSSMSVSGSFTLAATLVPLFSTTDISATILSFSFTDGRSILDSTNSGINNLVVSTDISGAILDWFIDFEIPFTSPNFIGQSRIVIQTASNASIIRDRGLTFECLSLTIFGSCSAPIGLDIGSIFNSAGSWTIASSPVSIPEPSTLLLFGVGLTGLMVFARRRRQV